jgi:hypothetical protein
MIRTLWCQRFAQGRLARNDHPTKSRWLNP